MTTTPATAARLGNVDVKGGLWGADLLAALADNHAALPVDTVRADSYGLPKRASTEHAARAAWTVLTAAWEEFTEAHTARVEAAGTDRYGSDRFTWDKWTRHLLAQLGYALEPAPSGGLRVDGADPDDPSDRYPISHTHHDQVPIHALPAGVPLDNRSHDVAGADRQSPHSLVQDYLNRTTSHRWAILTNGLTLRILRDNAALSRQAYIEFDLAGIFDESAYADFALLWHAAHATRFTVEPGATPADCIAEAWQDHADETGVAALDDLRDGVEAAIAEIGQGLLEHPANRWLREALADPDDPFDAAAYYRELLYVAYRHVFWFALDDRDLLHSPDADRHKVAVYRDHYASTVLRSKARSHLGGQHPDGWQHFTTVGGWFADPDGRPELAVPGLLGNLWNPDNTPHLADTTLKNRRYYEAVRRLGYVERDSVLHRINYDAMGSDELGAVYESLLEIRPTVDTQRRVFTLGRSDGSDRKKTGSYYTPTSLIKVLLDEALDPVLDDRLKHAADQLPPDAGPEDRVRAQEQALLDTTICDPAMGSAHFLVAAGMRAAKRLAAIRTGEVEPAPGAVSQAFRDVASRCLYGVDVNRMAVELAKVAIWLECHVPGQPLTFLDHHLKCGNALLGVGFDADLIRWNGNARRAADQAGVPDAAFKPLAGDDKVHAKLLRDANKTRRGGTQRRFRSQEPAADDLDRLADAARTLTDFDDASPDALAAKQDAYDAYAGDAELARQRLRADAWTASWTIPKTRDATRALLSDDAFADDQLPWDVYYDTFFDTHPDATRPGVKVVLQEAQRLRFFHWHVEFPDINARGGFDLMIGNPPWEHIELKGKEWFAAAGYDDIAHAPNAAARKKLIAALSDSGDPGDRDTATRWQRDSRDAQALSELARTSGRYPYGGVGRVNTYALFADHFTQSVSPVGRVGIIVPTGLITDYTYRDFFATLVDQRRLSAAYDFINKRQLFPDVGTVYQFTLLVVTGMQGVSEATLAFNLLDPAELQHANRSYALTSQQIALVSPNTKTAPVFLTPRDAEITTAVYERHPVLINHQEEDGNPWGIRFRQGIFNMATDSNLFHIAEQLEPEGWSLNDNIYERDNERMLPLYEAKMFQLFNSDATTYAGIPNEYKYGVKVGTKPTPPGGHSQPRYWVHESDVEKALGAHWREPAILAWRDITRATQSSRTTIAALLPRTALPDGCLIAMPEGGLPALPPLLATLGSFAFDYVARQKLSGMHLKFYIMEQLPAPSPTAFTETALWDRTGSLGDWVGSRAAALSASSVWMARALGYSDVIGCYGQTRGVWLNEIDAGMFHIFGYSRDEVDYVMDTFTVVARNDRKAEGRMANDPNWRIKRLVLAKYDELAQHAENGTTYTSPVPPPDLPPALRL